MIGVSSLRARSRSTVDFVTVILFLLRSDPGTAYRPAQDDNLSLTICFAAMHTVLMLNLRLHMSKRSSRLGPRRSITRMLCNPSEP